MDKEALREIRQDLGEIWDNQSQQIRLFRILKEQDNDIDNDTLDSLLNIKDNEMQIYERLMDKFDEILENAEN